MVYQYDVEDPTFLDEFSGTKKVPQERILEDYLFEGGPEGTWVHDDHGPVWKRPPYRGHGCDKRGYLGHEGGGLRAWGWGG